MTSLTLHSTAAANVRQQHAANGSITLFFDAVLHAAAAGEQGRLTVTAPGFPRWSNATDVALAFAGENVVTVEVHASSSWLQSCTCALLSLQCEFKMLWAHVPHTFHSCEVFVLRPGELPKRPNAWQAQPASLPSTAFSKIAISKSPLVCCGPSMAINYALQ